MNVRHSGVIEPEISRLCERIASDGITIIRISAERKEPLRFWKNLSRFVVTEEYLKIARTHNPISILIKIHEMCILTKYSNNNTILDETSWIITL